MIAHKNFVIGKISEIVEEVLNLNLIMSKKYVCLIIMGFIFCFDGAAQEKKDTSINLYFKMNSAELDALQYRNLKDFSTSVQSIKQIIGYADSTGELFYNISLSKKRALAVYNALQRDIDLLNKNILLFAGESTMESEMWMNRRVQVSGYLISLSPIKEAIEKGTDTVRNFNLEYVYFIPDQPIITDESLSYIQELAKNLKMYKTETFEIIGHINYQSRQDSSHLTDLYRLSELRAKAVYDYLIESGIPKTRMTFRGVGNSMPVYSLPVNEEQKRKNMRVQIIIKK